ncbi:MAG: DNA methyltransferase, partial [Candidatus Neomarinimicrobiota bacterium]|nr:DNA methyltransferase [Candidatus Neomarinimicrobiota bacterium]
MHSDILTVKDLDRYLPAIKTNEDMRFKNKLSEGVFLSDAIDGLIELPDESIDLIITEPSNGPKNEKTKKNSPTYTNYLDWMQVWLTESSRVLKSTGSIYIFCPWESSGMYHSLLSKKFHVQSRITIERNNESSDFSKSKWENELFDIWFATKTNDYIFNQNYVVDGKIIEDEKNQDSKSNLWFH